MIIGSVDKTAETQDLCMLKFFLRSDKLDNKIIYLDMYADFFHFMT